MFSPGWLLQWGRAGQVPLGGLPIPQSRLPSPRMCGGVVRERASCFRCARSSAESSRKLRRVAALAPVPCPLGLQAHLSLQRLDSIREEGGGGAQSPQGTLTIFPSPSPDLAQLRKKFEEDKQRIELMRAQRKFRPY